MVDRRKFISNTLIGVFTTLEANAFITGFPEKPGTDPEKNLLRAAALPALDNFHIIPHTHWEGAVFATREAYLGIGLPHIITALMLLKEYPEYRFTLDQVNYIRPFLERYEEEGKIFRQFVNEGRLEIVGGTDSMHDTNTPSGESIVRQMLYGKTYLRNELGVDVTVGWGIDTFGHSAQMPQILKLAGYKSLWFVRGVPNREMPSEFFWKGIDGTIIPAFWLPHSYVILARVPCNIADFSSFVKMKFDSLSKYSGLGKDRVGLAGWDVENPQEVLPKMVREFSRLQEMPFNLRFSVPTEYEATMDKRNDRIIFSGEFNPIFQGVYSSRIELKQNLRSVERILLTAEKLGAINNLLGNTTDDSDVWRAWEPTLFNQAHDLMSGVMTDHVYKETVAGYDFSRKLGEEIVNNRFDFIVSRIDTSGAAIPLVVFNMLSWSHTDVVETDVAFASGGYFDIEIIDRENNILPVDILNAEKYADGSIRHARIIFIARDVPPLGYTWFQAKPLRMQSKINSVQHPDQEEGVIENEFYIARFDLFTGGMNSLIVKSNKWEVLKKAGNVVARQYDGGDFWELYQNLRDGMVAKTTKQDPPTDFKERLSNENRYRGEKGTIYSGPVYSQFRVEHNFGTENKFSTTVRMYAGMRRIDINTTIHNIEKYVRYQVMFPTTIKEGKNVHEIPFGSIERPLGTEFPAQNWADYSDGEKGLALLNRGNPGNLTSDSTMMISLLRSSKIEDYPYLGGYEKWMTSDTGLQIGKTLTFDYALIPHEGDWNKAKIYLEGQEFINPLICHKSAGQKGKLPKKWSLLEVSHSNVIITAVKSGKDNSIIIRLYDASGKASENVTVQFFVKFKSIQAVNLLEDNIKPLKMEGNSIRFHLGPFEIKTFKLER